MPTIDPVEQAFLNDIVAHPDDPALWLILADWLEDRADSRAELVRLTWQLQYEPAHADFPTRQARVQALLAGGMKPVRPHRKLGDFEFVWIPPGSFLMGSPETEEQRYGDEQHHRVTLTRGFWFGVYTVTQGQFRAVMHSNPSAFSRTGRWGDLVEIRRLSPDWFPVEMVSWNDASRYCGELRQQLGGLFRLPTEAEWEYACRAGTTTPFHFGPALNGTEANCDGNHPYGTPFNGHNWRRTHKVGSYPPNAWGLYDMHGNVWEWCQDAYHAEYEKLPVIDPRDDDAFGGSLVLRGGSYNDPATDCRAAVRNFAPPDTPDETWGFRIVLLPPVDGIGPVVR
jgi:uncharacterized protein (TIGR02996 family)